MKIKILVIGVLISLILSIMLASASYNVGNASSLIDSVYGPTDYLRGWINMSFNNEPGDKLFTTSEGDEITLLKILQGSNSNFNCNPTGCLLGFSQSNPQPTKVFTLGAKETKYVGFVVTGIINSVDSVSLDLSSSAGPSCQNQILIDFLNDGVNDFGNIYPSVETCPFLSSYGCYNSAKSSVEFNVDYTPYCQTISLSESPGFEVGAWVKRNDSVGSRNLTISLYDKNGFEIPDASCVLPDATTQGGEISCNINHLITESDKYFVCLNTLQGSGKYKIKGYTDSINGCGFFGDPSPFRNPDAAYQIFATGKQFGPVGNISITNDFGGAASFSSAVEFYLRNVYGNGIDCSQGCVVPAKISSETGQTVTLKNLQVNLQTTSGSLTVKDFYDLTPSSPLITSEFQKINLNDFNLSVPSDFGNKSISINYDGNKILNKSIEVQTVAEINGLTPKKTFALYPTKFNVILDPSVKNVTQYEWDFGDGLPPVKTNSGTLKYAYQDIGEYDFKVSVTTASGLKGSKIFKVTVGSPSQIVDEVLAEKKDNLVGLISSVDSMPAFEKQEINKIVDTTLINDKLKEIEKSLEIAVSDADYVAVMDGLVSLNIPRSIVETNKGNDLIYFPSNKVVNLGIVKQVGTGDYDVSREQDYINAVFGWNQENLNTKINFKELSGQFDEFTTPILRVFELKISEKQPLTYDYNLFVRDIENLAFQGSYFEKEQGGYTVIPLSQESQTVKFSTTEEFDFNDVPAFISPDVSRLSLNPVNVPEYNNSVGLSRWIFFILILILLLIIALVAYVIMQEWYKRKYETYLFTDRNKLFNIISYIHNSKQNNLSDEEIERSLRRAGWNSEQVTYAMNKYAGKRTGMWELPVDRILNIFRKNRMNRQEPVKVAPRPQQDFSNNQNVGFRR